MVPHLITALNGPINALEHRVLESLPAIERWFRLEWMEHTPPFYTSVDLRNAGFKLAPVDTNLFPGGFNNLSNEMLPLAIQAAMGAVEKICPEAKNLLLIPEKHTRNLFYLSNIERLMQIFHQAGLNVRLGSLDATLKEATTITLSGGGTILLEPLVHRRGRLGLKDFDPCMILLNNDLSAGLPPILENLHEQYLLPPLHAGWAIRRKSKHFAAYNDVAKKFAKLLDIDPWLINPMFEHCEQINFTTGEGTERLVHLAESLLGQTRRKYKEFRIQEKPFLIVKADAGTYGMGIMTVRDPKDLIDLSRRTRNKMSVIKDGQEVSEVILQEGVPTLERIGEAVAEPVVYMIDRYVVGGFYRANPDRGVDENLNSPGAQFIPMPLAEPLSLTSSLSWSGEQASLPSPNRFYMYGVLARLAMLAAAYELEATDPAAESEA